MKKFSYVPEITEAQKGFKIIINKIKNKEKFAFVKINHGIWEMLVRLEKAGVNRTEMVGADGEKLDSLIGIEKVTDIPESTNVSDDQPNEQGLHKILGNTENALWATGLIDDLLIQISRLPKYDEGMIFVPSLEPWPHGYSMTGKLGKSYKKSQNIIRYFTDSSYLSSIEEAGFTGNELKSSVISGHFWELVSLLHDRPVFLIAHQDAVAVFRSIGLEHVDTFTVELSGARLQRHNIKEALFDWLEQHQGQNPVVATSAGEALCSWLGIEAFREFDDLQFIDLGGAMAAFSPVLSICTPWVKIYSKALKEQLDNWPLFVSEYMRPIYETKFPTRNPLLVDLAYKYGVQKPKVEDCRYIRKEGAIPFIDNKPPSFSRIGDYLKLSEKENNYTDSGPVAHLLEQAIVSLLNLPEHRKVMAVSSREMALYLSCEISSSEIDKTDSFRWVTSAFNYNLFPDIPPLNNTKIIDCNTDGTFDMKGFLALPEKSYDGVIYPNLGPNDEGWLQIQKKCKELDKALIVDNTNNLGSQPLFSLDSDAPIEIIAANHTMPWGHSDCGFIICNPEQETNLRRYSDSSGKYTSSLVANANISEVAAALVLDRIERMPELRPHFIRLKRRHKSWVRDAGDRARPLNKVSPLGFTTFLCKKTPNWSTPPKSFELQRYNVNLGENSLEALPIANNLYSRIFCISNSPEMRLISHTVFKSEIKKFMRN